MTVDKVNTFNSKTHTHTHTHTHILLLGSYCNKCLSTSRIILLALFVNCQTEGTNKWLHIYKITSIVSYNYTLHSPDS